MRYALAIFCQIVSQQVWEFLPHQPYHTWHFLYFHFSHSGGYVVVYQYGFKLHFILHGSVVVTGIKLRHLMKEVTTDLCLLSLSRDVFFLPHFRNNLFTEPSLNIQSSSGSLILRKHVIVSKFRHIPEYPASDIVYWCTHLFIFSQLWSPI